MSYSHKERDRDYFLANPTKAVDEIARLADRNKRLVVALKAVKPVMVRVSKTSLERVPVYPADEIDAILAEVKGGEE